MQIAVVAVGTRMQGWVNDGFNTYKKRLPPHLSLKLIEIPPGRRTARGDNARAITDEAEQLLKASAGADIRIALDEHGREWSSEELAVALRAWQDRSADVALLIGGPDGLHDTCRDACERVWSLSALTFPHGLVRIVLAEQLYRAWTILQGHPYHRS